jgi:hypothetical protein
LLLLRVNVAKTYGAPLTGRRPARTHFLFSVVVPVPRAGLRVRTGARPCVIVLTGCAGFGLFFFSLSLSLSSAARQMAFMLRSKVRTLVLSAAGAMEGFVVDTMDDLSKKVTQIGWEAAQLVCAVRTFWTAAGKPSRTMPDARTLYREAACCVTTLHGQPGAPTLYVHTAPPPRGWLWVARD